MELISKSHQLSENQKVKNLGREFKVLPPPLNDEEWELFKSLYRRWEVNWDVITTDNHSNYETKTKDSCPYCGSKKQGVSHADR